MRNSWPSTGSPRGEKVRSDSGASGGEGPGKRRERRKKYSIEDRWWGVFFLIHWLQPYGDRATIKLLNSWRQGWNWTELAVTWLPLPNDNLGFNQKKPLSVWLIQKVGKERLIGGQKGFIYTFFKEGNDISSIYPLGVLIWNDRGGERVRVRGYVCVKGCECVCECVCGSLSCSLLPPSPPPAHSSLIVWDCQENALHLTNHLSTSIWRLESLTK